MSNYLYVIFDVESTGLNIYKDKIFSIGIVITDGYIIFNKKEYSVFISLENIIKVETYMSSIVKINKEKVLKSDIYFNVITEIIHFLNTDYILNDIKLIFISHNVSFDYNMIWLNCKKISSKFAEEFSNLFYKKLDTIKLFKKFYKDSKIPSYSLDGIINFFNLKNKYTGIREKIEERKTYGHSALLDAELVFYLLLKLKSDFPFMNF